MDRGGGERADDARQYPHPGRRSLRTHSVRRQRLRGPRRMRLRYRTILSAATLALSFALVGCETADVVDKLTDMIPFGDSKKPLPGERKEVFPQGVPGVPQGVPADMVKGNQPPPEAAPPPQATAAPPPAEKPKPKKKGQAQPEPPAGGRRPGGADGPPPRIDSPAGAVVVVPAPHAAGTGRARLAAARRARNEIVWPRRPQFGNPRLVP